MGHRNGKHEVKRERCDPVKMKLSLEADDKKTTKKNNLSITQNRKEIFREKIMNEKLWKIS